MSAPAQNNLPLPKEWGPHVWYTIDVFAKGYGEEPTPELRVAAKNFFESLGELLPCEKCRGHYRELLVERPVVDHLSSQTELELWVAWVKAEVKQKIVEYYKDSGDSLQLQTPTPTPTPIQRPRQLPHFRKAIHRSVVRKPIARKSIARNVSRRQPIQKPRGQLLLRGGGGNSSSTLPRQTANKASVHKVPTITPQQAKLFFDRQAKILEKNYVRPCACG